MMVKSQRRGETFPSLHYELFRCGTLIKIFICLFYFGKPSNALSPHLNAFAFAVVDRSQTIFL